MSLGGEADACCCCWTRTYFLIVHFETYKHSKAKGRATREREREREIYIYIEREREHTLIRKLEKAVALSGIFFGVPEEKFQADPMRKKIATCSGRIKHAPKCGHHFVSPSPPWNRPLPGARKPPFSNEVLLSPGNWGQKVTKNCASQLGACLILSDML